jgi:hypothetical protein
MASCIHVDSGRILQLICALHQDPLRSQFQIHIEIRFVAHKNLTVGVISNILMQNNPVIIWKFLAGLN